MDENIILSTNDINNVSKDELILETDEIPKMLEEKDILSKMEEGTNTTSNSSNHNLLKRYYTPPVEKLQKYINLHQQGISRTFH